MACVDAQSVIIFVLSNPIFPVVRALIFSARMPVFIVIGIALVGVVVVVGFPGHGFPLQVMDYRVTWGLLPQPAACGRRMSLWERPHRFAWQLSLEHGRLLRK